MYFPTWPVRYPVSWSHFARVLVWSRPLNPPPEELLFDVTPWLCGYCPVSRLARAGQHSGIGTMVLAKVVPRPVMSSCTAGSAVIWSADWSSVMKKTMFGRVPSADGLLG